MIYRVILAKRATKDLEKLPRYVTEIFFSWVLDVERRGLEEVRKIPGFHDEPCRGTLEGFRSICLTRGYRAYYRIVRSFEVFAYVERIDKHEY